MLDAAFSFRGRVNRLQYFMGVMALFFAVAIPLALGGATVLAHPTASAIGGSLLVILLLLLAAPVLGWVGLSLQARRFRDIGWNPAYVIPGLVVANIIDQLIALAVPGLAIGPFQRQTILGLLISLGAGGALLFWPGKPDAADAPADDTRWVFADDPDLAPLPEAPLMAAPAMAVPAPPLQAAPVRAAAPAAPSRAAPPLPRTGAPAVTFGRRGL
jgi:uncharacterized membrane protein YhaH (DUF805 family)